MREWRTPPQRHGARLVAFIAVVLFVSSPAHGADDERVKLAADSLRREQTASGLLRYDFDFLSGAPSGDDNPVRQAGVIAFLAEYLLESRDVSVEPTIQRALGRFAALSLPIGKKRLQAVVEWAGLLSLPAGRYKLRWTLDHLGLLYQSSGNGRVLTLSGDYDGAVTGATAMALLAELRYRAATGDSRFEAARAGWLDGLTTLYVRGSGFRSKPTTIDSSEYSDGEGWLALAYQDRLRPGDPVVGGILPRLDGYFLDRYASRFSPEFYQWGTMAAAVRWESTKHPRFARLIHDQAVRALEWLARARLQDNTCATMEGLVTAASVLRDVGNDGDLVGRIEETLRAEMRKNLGLQIARNSGRRQFSETASVVSPQLANFVGAFLHQPYSPYTRIDFTGHCLSAMVKVKRYDNRDR